MFLQVLSRNIIHFYVFVVFTIGALALCNFENKFGKFFVLFSCIGYICLFAMALNLHLQFGLVADYIIVAIETLIVLALTVVYILPIKKKKVSHASERLFLHRAMGRHLLLFGEEPNEKNLQRKLYFHGIIDFFHSIIR